MNNGIPQSIDWTYPTSVKVGPGRVNELPELCKLHDIRRPLLVTDPLLVKTPMLTSLLQMCRDAGLALTVFSQVKGNPSGRNVSEGVCAYNQGDHDGVIAFGGGSAIDAAKAVALMVGQDRPLWDFEDIGDNHLRVRPEGIAPLIAIPTTAGTGSEVGRASVITDEDAQIKRTIMHLRMMPCVAILDAELTVSMPRVLTATTGMDALTHCMEAYCSPIYHPMAEGIAAEGIRMIKAALPQVVQDGQDLHARQQMLVASALGAAAFQRGLGAVHALAQTLGALYDSHHGLLNAIILPYVLRANQAMPAEPLERLSRYLDLPQQGWIAVQDWVLHLRKQTGIPHTLRDIGIDETQAQLVCEMALSDGCSDTNPVPVSLDYYARLFQSALDGVL